MKTEEIIEVLQAYEDGKELEVKKFYDWVSRSFKNRNELLHILSNGCTIRVKPEPKIEKVELYTCFDDEDYREMDICILKKTDHDTHRITYNLVDGEPDLDSFKIEKI